MDRQECSLCKSINPRLASNKDDNYFEDKQEAITHARIHWSQLKMISDDGVSEEEIYKKCFPANVVQGEEIEEQLETSSFKTLFEMCRTILAQKSKAKEARIVCNECSLGLNVHRLGSPHHLCVNTIYDHALAHFGTEVYECKRCDRGFCSKMQMRTHLRRVHNIRHVEKEYRDMTGMFTDGISAMITRCFAEGNKEEAPKEIASKIKTETHIRRIMKGSTKLTVERTLYLNGLCKKTGPDRENPTVECRVCSKRIIVFSVAKGFSAVGAMEHAFVHLLLPIYRCKQCSITFHSSVRVRAHLRRKHDLTFPRNHEYFGDDYHLEIMDMLKKCYDRQEEEIGDDDTS